MKIRTAVVEGGLVVNIIEFDDAVPESLVDGQIWIASDDAQIGDGYADGAFISHEKPVAPATSIPQSVTMRQARLALLKAGKLDAVNAAVAGMSGLAGDTARIEWEFSSTVERDLEYVQQIMVGLGMTDKQLDDLFVSAASM